MRLGYFLVLCPVSVAKGPFQNANLRYFVDPAYHGQGYATSAVKDIVRYALSELGLHCIQAVKTNDVWEDHVLYAITAEDLQQDVF